MDILFKNDDFVFSYRVGGILKHNGKILLQRPKNDDYAIIGGHVAAMETSMETLKREFEEELHAKIEVDNLLAIGEIYFPWGKRPCHQICFLAKSAKPYMQTLGILWSMCQTQKYGICITRIENFWEKNM